MRYTPVLPEAGHRRARWGGEPTVTARLMFRPRLKAAAIHGLNSSFPSQQRLLIAQNDETPVGSAFRGLLGEIAPGTAIWSAPATHANLRLTHQNFQDARGRTAGIHEIPCAAFQRRALPRVKSC
jgi:hypothetical protein